MTTRTTSQVFQEAVNYFTLLSLANQSEKRLANYHALLDDKIDPTLSLVKQFNVVAKVLNLPIGDVTNAYNHVLHSLQSLFREYRDAKIVKIGSDGYPKLLATLNGAPAFLFLYGIGELFTFPIVSIVGTRNASTEGKLRARKLAALLAKRNIVVASGLAKGIDYAAHEGTIVAGGYTIAVLGTPLNRFYPKEHEKLQRLIGETGLLVSQFSPSAQVMPYNFPKRNFVMSGMSLATVVIEAGESSGALIQADFALKQKRKLFIPRSILNDNRLKWPARFIKGEGASVFADIDDLVEKLSPYLPGTADRQGTANQSTRLVTCSLS
ncbi:MAG: DNA-protecting protein DprA [Peptococcaceae bacterium]|nr:DNA-protecting protein DprA [Peptococcaceae bacterium]